MVKSQQYHRGTRPPPPSPSKIRKEKHKKAAICLLGALSGVAAVLGHVEPHLKKKRMHTSILTGQKWVDELLAGHPLRFRRQMGMSRFVFRKLLTELEEKGGLTPTRHVSSEEQLAIFLRIARTGLSNAEMQERFQRSGDTISKAFHRILNILVSKEFYNTYVQLPENVVPPEILDNPKYFPYFSDCRGAIDGSLLHAFVSKADMARFRSRKGFISTNLLAGCLFNMQFCYILAGWEGSAADSRIFANARRSDFEIEPGTYYLADSGFPLCDSLLVPYRSVRYHLKEWEQAGLRPVNYKELFNLRHATLRNVIERIFGVCKRRFKLMSAAAEYSLRTQSKIPGALAALHNFIHIHDPDDLAFDDGDEDGSDQVSDTLSGPNSQREDRLGRDISNAEKNRASARRDEIAKEMWKDYEEELRIRGLM